MPIVNVRGRSRVGKATPVHKTRVVPAMAHARAPSSSECGTSGTHSSSAKAGESQHLRHFFPPNERELGRLRRRARRNADRDRGAESDGGHLRVVGVGKRSGPTLRQVDVSGDGAGTNATEHSDGRPVRRVVGWVTRAASRVCHPNWRIVGRSSRRRIGAPGLPGAAARRRDGNGPGNREPGRQRGIARRAFGHDGRCEVEPRLTPTDRPSVDGSSH
jgi:hypothetical protein